MPQPMYSNPGMNGEMAFIDPNDPYNNANRGAPGQQRLPTPPANRQQPAPPSQQQQLSDAYGVGPAPAPFNAPPPSQMQQLSNAFGAGPAPPAPNPPQAWPGNYSQSMAAMQPPPLPPMMPGGFPAPPPAAPPMGPPPMGAPSPQYSQAATAAMDRSMRDVGNSQPMAGGAPSMQPPPPPMDMGLGGMVGAAALGGLPIDGGGAPPALPPQQANALNPLAANNAMQAYLAGQGGGPPANMAFPQGTPGTPPPMPGMEAITDDAGNTYFTSAGAPGTASAINNRMNAGGVQGLPSWDSFRQNMLHSGMNTAQMQDAYARMSNRQQTQGNNNQATANDTTRTNAQFGPGGLASQDMALRGRALDQQNFPNTPEGRQTNAANALIQGFLNPAPGQPRPSLGELVNTLNSLHQTGLLGRPGSPAPGASAPIIPAGAGGAAGVVPSAGPYTSPSGGPAPLPYEGIRSSLDEIYNRTATDRSPGSFLDRVNSEMPAGFADANMAGIYPYMRDRFGQGPLNEAAAGVINSPTLGPVSRQSLGGWGGSLGPTLSAMGQQFFGGGNNWTADTRGRSLLNTYLQSNPNFAR